MLKRFLSLKISIPVALVGAVTAGGLLLRPVAQAFAPPTFDDTLTRPIDKRGFRWIGGTNWACGGGCVAARTGGAARRGCVLYVANQAGTFRGAADDCSVALAAACTGQAVDDCASGERF
jgi:hypothetical protein